jgi:hypothetical protein
MQAVTQDLPRGHTDRRAQETAALMSDVVNLRDGLNEDLIDSAKVPSYLRLFLHAKRSSKHGEKDLFDCWYDSHRTLHG